MSSLVILIPTLGRPHHIEPLLTSIRTATPHAKPLFIVTEGDDVVKTIDQFSEEHISIPPQNGGDYAKKINYGYQHSTEEHIFLGATDLNFFSNWYEAAINKLSDNVHVVGTNDLGNQAVLEGRHSTHSLVTRYYCDTYGTIDEPGKILHEGYDHEFVDDEFVQTAMYRNAWAFAPASIVEHMHPSFGKGEWDEHYHATPIRMMTGQFVFDSRRHLWT